MKIPFSHLAHDELENDALMKKTDLFRSIASTGGFMDPITSGDESDTRKDRRWSKSDEKIGDDVEMRRRLNPKEPDTDVRPTEERPKVTFRITADDSPE